MIIHNTFPYPIEFYWVDVDGRKGRYVKSLAPGEKRQEETYITHPWVFKQSNHGIRLYAFSNILASSVFEGEKFGVIPNSRLPIHVIISTKGRLFIPILILLMLDNNTQHIFKSKVPIFYYL